MPIGLLQNLLVNLAGSLAASEAQQTMQIQLGGSGSPHPSLPRICPPNDKTSTLCVSRISFGIFSPAKTSSLGRRNFRNTSGTSRIRRSGISGSYDRTLDTDTAGSDNFPLTTPLR
ncbi:hypothetical protein K450DRAFT_225727 [Umbelopsis ramanniana AG]|uniref:Secreted protein n=1 Tax=Umbelopsis ramanniana AG TaxID=1314678 RepID=A0AAD5EGV7_UMBRA|nr:uncharacterized protein K450DRAFT_225727 [Umbelopsis ramanniana AG]KAI8582979.1 hypothetical protein K450DRAFT_225727 [Umbelopsis ramanniana AG]